MVKQGRQQAESGWHACAGETFLRENSVINFSQPAALAPLAPLAALQPRHFAFMRAVVQGMSPRQSWERYLIADGTPADERSALDLIAWIDDLYAATAQRHGWHGPRRLAVFRRKNLAAAEAAPSLSEFVASMNLENFSESEQLDAYRSRNLDHEPAHATTVRQARQVVRRLQALYWLEQVSAELTSTGPREIHQRNTAQANFRRPSTQPGCAPSRGAGIAIAADDLVNWIAPALAGRLAAAGLQSHGDLQRCLARHGPRWWYGIAGIGPVKAARIMRRLAADPQTGVGQNPDFVAWVSSATRQTRATGASCVPPSGAMSLPALSREIPPTPSGSVAVLDPARIRPLQQLAACEPQAASAGGGIDRPGCVIAAKNDLEAMRTWLHAKRAGAAGAFSTMPECLHGAVPSWADLTSLTHTQRAYWKEAERFQLWLYLARGSSLSFANSTDCQAYLDFLRAPAPTWCGCRAQRRQEATWRPYAGPLSPTARGFSCAVLRALCGYLVDAGYLSDNPWNTVVRMDSAPARDAPRHAPISDPVMIARTTPGPPSRSSQATRSRMPVNCTDHRLRVALLLQRDSGLSPAALVRLTCFDLRKPQRSGEGWRLCLPGRRTPARVASDSRQGSAASARPRQLAAAKTVRIADDTLRAMKMYFAKRGLAWPPMPARPAAHAVSQPVYLLGRASDAAQRAPWAPCARAAVDPVAGVAAGTLRDQIRRATRAASAAPVTRHGSSDRKTT